MLVQLWAPLDAAEPAHMILRGALLISSLLRPRMLLCMREPWKAHSQYHWPNQHMMLSIPVVRIIFAAYHYGRHEN